MLIVVCVDIYRWLDWLVEAVGTRAGVEPFSNLLIRYC